MTPEQPKELSPAEKSEINKERTAVEADLILGGAKHKESEEGQFLEVTKEQIKEARKEMKEDFKERKMAERSGPIEEETFSEENKKGYESLNSDGKTLLDKIYERAADRDTDGWLSSRLAAWGSKHLVGRYEEKMGQFEKFKNDSEKNLAEASGRALIQAKEIIDVEKTMAERGVILSQETRDKFAQQRAGHLEDELKYKKDTEFLEGRLRGLGDAKTKYEQKLGESVDKICSKWEGKIEGNNKENADQKTLAEGLRDELKNSWQEKSKLEADINKLEKKAEGYKDPGTKKEMERFIIQQRELLKATEANFNEKQKAVDDNKRRSEELKAENGKLGTRISGERDKWLGKKTEQKKSAKKEEYGKEEIGGRKKEKTTPGEKAQTAEFNESKIEKEWPMREYIEAWNTKSKFKLKVETDDLMYHYDGIDALIEIQDRLAATYKKPEERQQIKEELKKLKNTFIKYI